MSLLRIVSLPDRTNSRKQLESAFKSFPAFTYRVENCPELDKEQKIKMIGSRRVISRLKYKKIKVDQNLSKKRISAGA